MNFGGRPHSPRPFIEVGRQFGILAANDFLRLIFWSHLGNQSFHVPEGQTFAIELPLSIRNVDLIFSRALKFIRWFVHWAEDRAAPREYGLVSLVSGVRSAE